MKKCELCDNPAKIYCESDQASLCWDCDSKVHNANFLVAKHSRTLLCHVCQSLTPWNGSGPNLGPTVSVCDNCVNSRNRGERFNDEARDGDDDDDDDDDDEDLDRDDDADDEEEEEEDDDDDDDDGNEDEEENQVVPGSSTPPPPVSSSSTSEECSSRFYSNEEGASESKIGFSLKRTRENAKPCSQDGHVCSSQQSHNAYLSSESASLGSFRPLKTQKRTVRTGNTETQSRSKSVLDSLKEGFQQRMIARNDKSTTVLGIRKLSNKAP